MLSRTTRRPWKLVGVLVLLLVGLLVAAPSRHDQGPSRREGPVPNRLKNVSRSEPRLPEEPSPALEGPFYYADPDLTGHVEVIRRAGARRGTPSWIHQMPTIESGVIAERWRSPSAGDCRGDDRMCSGGAGEWVDVELFPSVDSQHVVAGYLFSTRELDEVTGWAVEVRIFEGRERVLGQGFVVALSRETEGGPDVRFDLGSMYTIVAGDLSCRVAIGAPGSGPAEELENMHRELGRLLESPTSFHSTVDARLGDLLEEAEAAVQGSRTTSATERLEPKPSRGCTSVSLRPDEAMAMLERLESEIAARRALLDENAVLFHTLLSQAVPAELIH